MNIEQSIHSLSQNKLSRHTVEKLGLLEIAHEQNDAVLRVRIQKEGLVDPGFEAETSAARLRNRLIVGIVARKISELCGQKCVISTARIRSGLKGNLLHPVATWPAKLNTYFLEPTHYEKFPFSPAAFDDGFGSAIECGDHSWHAKQYSLAEFSSRPKEGPMFASRIVDFLSSVGKDASLYGLEPNEITQLKERGTCLAFGGTKIETDFSPKRSIPNEFYYFFALYLLPGKEGQAASIDLKESNSLLSEMFNALEISDHDDKEDFERDGLEMVSKLIPALTNRDIAPSDAIGFFLAEMEGILKRHTLGFEDRHTWVRFIAVDNVFENDGKLKPSFQIFPHHQAAGSLESAIGAFLISHPKRLSVVKLIVRQWAKNSGIPLSESFEKLFSQISTDDAIFDSKLGCACFSADDGKIPWRDLNLDVTPDQAKKTRCTLGFVIERDDPKSPYAIIAFESDIPDAFSRQDIERFRSVIDACSSLLLGLNLSSASFDIKHQIREAFDDTSTLKRLDGIAFGKFRFELLRLDQDILMKIIESSDDRIWKGIGIEQSEAKEFLSKVLETMPGATDDMASDKKAEDDSGRVIFDRILRERNKWIVENENTLHSRWEKSKIASGIYNFLATIPSNIVWHCYLNAVSRAIAFRPIAGGKSTPSFMVMDHGGHSALAMFVFSAGRHEFRQIIKLSDRDRIGREEENYRLYVRYNVPLSARLPFSGTAYESDGNVDDSTEKFADIPLSRRSFGALVSDLIAGSSDESKGPVTLLGKMLELIRQSRSREKWHESREVADFKAAIIYQFENNTARWRNRPNEKGWVSGDSSVADTVREISRVHLPGELDAFTAIKERLGGDTPASRLMRDVVEKLSGVRFDTVFTALADYDRMELHTGKMNVTKLGSVIHGDLNARNLVWSQDYLKFFMIDFERVRLGFYGADQLRLTFSVLSDLIVDAYQAEAFYPTVTESDMQRRIDEVELIVEDILTSMKFIRDFMATVKDLENSSAGPADLVSMIVSNRSVSALALSSALATINMSSGDGRFWAFAMVMAAAKQLEYALRSLDDSCIKTLERLKKDTEVAASQRFNFYRYFKTSELKGRVHDKFVLAKIARITFAYCALAEIIVSEMPSAGN